MSVHSLRKRACRRHVVKAKVRRRREYLRREARAAASALAHVEHAEHVEHVDATVEGVVRDALDRVPELLEEPERIPAHPLAGAIGEANPSAE